MKSLLNHRICVAPMMAYTDCHFRYLLRLISPNAFLYTEMVTANAILHGDYHYLLTFHDAEHPVAVQLGGSEPSALAKAAKICEQYQYDEINLNVGCPSERVQNGCFGAALMKEPDLVVDCVKAMQDAVSLPITVKTRLGVDDIDSDDYLTNFIGKLMDAGCDTFFMHARKAWLQRLSPKENRDIPPLQYDRVYQLKKTFPQCKFVINGGIQTIDAIQNHLEKVDGVMLGRVVCSNPYFLHEVDRALDKNILTKTREEIVQAYLPYILREYADKVPMRQMTRHLIGLYQGEKGSRSWRRLLSDGSKDDLQLLRALEMLIQHK